MLEVLSNVAFLIPIGLAVAAGLWWHVGVASLSMLASLAYHLADERRFYLFDHWLAIGLMVANLALVLSGKPKWYSLAILLILIASAFLLLYAPLPYLSKETRHSVWHLASAIITAFAIFIRQDPRY